MPRANDPDAAGYRLAHGPRALEAALLADLGVEIARMQSEPSLLAEPLLVVVPSRSLRLHVAAAFRRGAGPALAGVRIQTLFGLAQAVHASAGVEPARGRLLFEQVIRACALDEPVLARELAAFESGTQAVIATIADLFDAGFAPANAAALASALSAGETARIATARETERASALVRVAAATADVLASLGRGSSPLGPPAFVLRQARELVRAEPRTLVARAIWIHGFSDATGAVAELLETLIARSGSRVYWDTCADGRFGAGLRSRLGVRIEPDSIRSRADSARPELVRADHVDVEVRVAVERVRAAIDSGVAPEAIGVVARDLGPYRVALRTHCARLAIPFSAHGTDGLAAAPERRAHALSALLEMRADASIERWLDARAPFAAGECEAGALDLDLALRALGTGRIRALAELDITARFGRRNDLKLPVRVRRPPREDSVDDESEQDEDDDPDASAESGAPAATAAARPLQRRSVPRADIEAAQREARALVDALENWPARAAAHDHVVRLAAFTRDRLHWTDDLPGTEVLARALDVLRADIPPELVIDRASFLRCMRAALAEATRTPLGGRGGGIQVLNVVEARGRTFEHLVVLGLNRGRFPRNVREDPLLSDAVRARMTSILPDLASKSSGRDEERCLFEQLVRSSRTLTLSWLTLDAGDKPLLVSPLVERVATPAEIALVVLAAPLYSPRAQSMGVRPAHERSILAALARGRAGLADTAACALRSARRRNRLDPAAADAIASARLAILSELDAPRATTRLGPYFGFVGMLRDRDDLRTGSLWVTTLENVRRCGWQALLGKVLRLEPAPDPLAALPEVDALIVGQVVHAVLQTIHGRPRTSSSPAHDLAPDTSRRSALVPQANTLAAVRALAPRVVRWPKDEVLERRLREAARDTLHEAGVLLPGLEHLVAERGRGFVLAARELDVREASEIEGTLDTEVEGAVELPAGVSGLRSLRFRADRVDRISSEPDAVRLTDYKTGAPLTHNKTAKSRHEHHVKKIGSGAMLQSMVYAIAAGAGGVGRYAYLGERVAEDARVFAIALGEPHLRDHYDHAVETLLGSWDSGAFFPRLLDEKASVSNKACALCEMSRACVRGDSGAHHRIARFVRTFGSGTDSEAAHSDLTDAEEAVLKLWSLEMPAGKEVT